MSIKMDFSVIDDDVALINNVEITSTPCSNGTRTIFIFGELIIKYDNDPDFPQCSREVKFWLNELEDCDREYFAKLIAWGDRWVAQELVDLDDSLVTVDKFNLIKSICRKYGILDIYLSEYPWGRETKNWGVKKDGTPVIFDWGCVY